MNSLLLSTLGLVTVLGVTAAVPPLTPVTLAREVILAQNSPRPLAKELQGKPVVVDIYASWCPGCKNIAPTLSRLEQQYAGKANFIKLDVSDRKTTEAAEEKARKLGLSEFLKANKSQTSMVAIIDPATGEIIKQFRNNPNLKDYTMVIDGAISSMKK
ncbi:thioredoxin domain-containing protein [Pannus brasiliensis CCIBt3594]|uniref:Thioredoxin domain-containing protein n=1 Tax=Pannus brasiliensis CCIBt3594 TaxID=1427578 RepID=A0AAW9QZ22_9CHRO